MRGKGGRKRKCGKVTGITPAGAGKSYFYVSNKAGSGDHPRMCREKGYQTSQLFALMGLSLHMQGKTYPPPCSYELLGVTPVDAGKRHSPCMHGSDSRDHPRRCGEKLHFGCARRLVGGITPAGAGKSNAAHYQSGLHRDHHCICREKAFRQAATDLPFGSSPHTRGKAESYRVGTLERRISPADAGIRYGSQSHH